MKSYSLWEILKRHHVGQGQKARVAPFLEPALLSNGRYSLRKADILMLDAIADLKKTSTRPGLIGQPRPYTTRTPHKKGTGLPTPILGKINIKLQEAAEQDRDETVFTLSKVTMSNRIQRIEEKLDKLLEIWY